MVHTMAARHDLATESRRDTIAAAAAECSTSQLLEPVGHALWEAASTCHHEEGSGVNGGGVGGGGGGGVALSGWLAGVITNAVTVGLLYELSSFHP